MKRIFVLLALVMALGFTIPLAAGPIDTGPPVTLALSSTVTPFDLPAVSSSAVYSAPESSPNGILYVSQLDLEPTLAGLMYGVALSMLLLSAFIAKGIYLKYDQRSRFIRFARDQCTAS